jgi:hypothetical protein
MKHHLILCHLAILSICAAQGQVVFNVGASPNGFFVQNGTTINLYGLKLEPALANPATGIDLSANSMTVLSTADPLTPPSINRVYVFTNTIEFTGTLGIYYNEGELNDNTESDLQVAYYLNPDYTVTTGSSVTAPSDYIENSFNAPISFSRVTATGSEAALPVTLVAFKARKEGPIAQLNWQTSAETNSDHFGIQRSSNGKNWAELGKVNAWYESNNLRSYFFDDVTPAPGMNYYRLKMVDRNGQFAYSPIESLRFEDNRAIASIYPNPVMEKLRIQADDWSSIDAIKLLNTQGKTFFESGNSLADREIDMHQFPSGTYLVQLTRSNGDVSVLKVVKN